MDTNSKQQYMRTLREEYLKSDKKSKTAILDEYCKRTKEETSFHLHTPLYDGIITLFLYRTPPSSFHPVTGVYEGSKISISFQLLFFKTRLNKIPALMLGLIQGFFGLLKFKFG